MWFQYAPSNDESSEAKSFVILRFYWADSSSSRYKPEVLKKNLSMWFDSEYVPSHDELREAKSSELMLFFVEALNMWNKLHCVFINSYKHWLETF